jgi:hypothetical protein
MNRPPPAAFTAVLQRKDPKLPVYVVVPFERIARWNLEATAVVEGSINGQALGRRTMKRMSASKQSNWFIECTAPFCRAAGIAVGDKLNVSLLLASNEQPVELEALLTASPSLQATWNSLSEYARRTSAEHVRAAKTEATRQRRAQAIVGKLIALQQSGMPRDDA